MRKIGFVIIIMTFIASFAGMSSVWSQEQTEVQQETPSWSYSITKVLTPDTVDISERSVYGGTESAKPTKPEGDMKWHVIYLTLKPPKKGASLTESNALLVDNAGNSYKLLAIDITTTFIYIKDGEGLGMYNGTDIIWITMNQHVCFQTTETIEAILLFSVPTGVEGLKLRIADGPELALK